MEQYGKISDDPISPNEMDALVEEVYKKYTSNEKDTFDEWLHDVVYGIFD